MQTKIVPFSTFQENMRVAVLRSLDSFIAGVMETTSVRGWKDEELNRLFVGVDSHAYTLARRINAGHEVNSAYVRIDMES